jgi:hypothetical protein
MNDAISLYDLEQAALIVLNKEAPVYTNQTGGSACKQPRENGFLVPITNDPPLDSGYEETLSYKLSELCRDMIGLTGNTANAIELLLKAECHEHSIEVDRSLLSKSMEAWVYVTVDTKSAVLTWCNSD